MGVDISGKGHLSQLSGLVRFKDISFKLFSSFVKNDTLFAMKKFELRENIIYFFLSIPTVSPPVFMVGVYMCMDICIHMCMVHLHMCVGVCSFHVYYKHLIIFILYT